MKFVHILVSLALVTFFANINPVLGTTENEATEFLSEFGQNLRHAGVKHAFCEVFGFGKDPMLHDAVVLGYCGRVSPDHQVTEDVTTACNLLTAEPETTVEALAAGNFISWFGRQMADYISCLNQRQRGMHDEVHPEQIRITNPYQVLLRLPEESVQQLAKWTMVNRICQTVYRQAVPQVSLKAGCMALKIPHIEE